MKQIKIGTCVPGPVAEEWLKGFVGKGFETFSLNFHMSLEGTDLDKLALTTDKLLAGTDSKITTLGYYCNPIQYAEHRKTLEKVICTAEKFGATHVSTFAGAWEGKPVESAYEEFGKVFRELADLAEEKGVKLGIENCLMDGTWEHATCNIGFNPKAWEVMFEEVKNDNFGLEWEPTHQMVQLIDPVTELRKWCKKIVHVHGKDATIDWDAVRHGGISGAVPFGIQDRITGFISRHSGISKERLEELMLDTTQLVKDVGTMLEGEEAVKEGLIDEVGGISSALQKLYSMIHTKKKKRKENL